MIKENSVPKNTKDATKFGETLFKGKISSFLLIKLNKPLKF